MINFPTCKINLGLQVLKRRFDGYHDIDSAMLEIPLNDVLEVIESTEDSFTTTGLEIPGSGNLILQAKELFEKTFPLPSLAFHLHKNIPMGAGLGGGSSDAAFALKIFRDVYYPAVSDDELEKYCAQLGSDCAFFVRGGLQLASGRGEVLKPISINFSGYSIYLVNLGIHISTQQAYSLITPDADRLSVAEILQKPISFWKDELVNDFEVSAFQLYPALKHVKDLFYQLGAFYAAMSGSGSTMFALFEKSPSAIKWPFKVEFERILTL